MPYEGLLRWLTSDVLPDSGASEDRLRPLLEVARRLDHAVMPMATPTRTCGIEVHHDGSGRVDLGVLLDWHGTAGTAGLQFPPWWPTLPDHEARSAMLPMHHFLEFDAVGPGGLALAGVFQTVRPAEIEPSAGRLLLLDHLVRMQIPRDMLDRSTRLARILECLGLPEQVGLMVGRQSLLKIVAPLDGANAAGISTVLQDVTDTMGASMKAVRHAIDTAVAALAAEHGPIRLSLDLDLARDVISPRIGLEIPVGANGGGHLARPVVSMLADVAAVPPSTLAAVQAVTERLPAARQRHPRPAPAWMRHHVARVPHLRIARCSHIKLVVSPGVEAQLKTYVEVREEPLMVEG